MATAAILELPGKGAFAPNKFGCRHGSFIKTDIPGKISPLWIYEGKLYSTAKEADIKDFNEMCAEVIPHCHRRKMRVVPRIIHLPTKKRAKKAAKEPKGGKTQETAPPAQNANTGQEGGSPTPPALTAPPSGGKE